MVVQLINQAKIPSNEGYTLLFDNYFSSISLFSYLAEHGYCATATIQHGRTEETTGNRYSPDCKSRISITQPKPLANYNKGMGGVDEMNQLVPGYRTRMRQKKWWWSIFAYLFNVFVTNAWLLMRKICPNEDHAPSLLRFRSLTMVLLITHGPPSLIGKIVQPPNDGIR
ncbi:hypothetical protein ILUMI_16887 [Ignelater luminosus]|uniref:PiggyBac transposable element-derived protein domain-containing protein n=1 Tax=Ignelater luminosus TaxID=2038154 RepID=A0A8K0CQF2_IGNLU|nr:hypothetical protein ILUMI_16887 [Ignelater luminosus]